MSAPHSWQLEERDALQILFHEYDLNAAREEDVHRIFNGIYTWTTGAPTVNKLRDQWRGRFKDGRSKTWSTIHSKPLAAYMPAERVRRAAVRVEVLRQANALGIQLTPTQGTATLHTAALASLAGTAPNGADVPQVAAVHPTAVVASTSTTAVLSSDDPPVPASTASSKRTARTTASRPPSSMLAQVPTFAGLVPVPEKSVRIHDKTKKQSDASHKQHKDRTTKSKGKAAVVAGPDAKEDPPRRAHPAVRKNRDDDSATNGPTLQSLSEARASTPLTLSVSHKRTSDQTESVTAPQEKISEPPSPNFETASEAAKSPHTRMARFDDSTIDYVVDLLKVEQKRRRRERTKAEELAGEQGDTIVVSRKRSKRPASPLAQDPVDETSDGPFIPPSRRNIPAFSEWNSDRAAVIEAEGQRARDEHFSFVSKLPPTSRPSNPAHNIITPAALPRCRADQSPPTKMNMVHTTHLRIIADATHGHRTECILLPSQAFIGYESNIYKRGGVAADISFLHLEMQQGMQTQVWQSEVCMVCDVSVCSACYLAAPLKPDWTASPTNGLPFVHVGRDCTRDGDRDLLFNARGGGMGGSFIPAALEERNVVFGESGPERAMVCIQASCDVCMPINEAGNHPEAAIEGGQAVEGAAEELEGFDGFGIADNMTNNVEETSLEHFGQLGQDGAYINTSTPAVEEQNLQQPNVLEGDNNDAWPPMDQTFDQFWQDAGGNDDGDDLYGAVVGNGYLQ